MIIQNEHRIKIKTTKNSSAKFKKIDNFFLATKITLSIKIKTFKPSKRRQANVYVEKTRILKNEQGQNVSIIHKSLTVNNYVFESIQRRDMTMKFYSSCVNAIIFSTCDSIPIANFGEAPTKINKKQLLKRLISFKSQKISIMIDYDYANVFFDKIISVFEKKNSINSESTKSFEFDKNANVFFNKIVFAFELENSINSFIIKTSEINKKKSERK